MLLISQFNFYVVNQILSLINLCFPTQGSITSRLHWCTPSCCNDSLLLTTLYDREFYSSNLHFYLHLYNFQIIANYCTLCGLENSSKRKVFQNRLSECHIYMCLNLTLYCYILFSLFFPTVDILQMYCWNRFHQQMTISELNPMYFSCFNWNFRILLFLLY